MIAKDHSDATDLHVSACEDIEDAETWFDEEMSDMVR